MAVVDVDWVGQATNDTRIARLGDIFSQNTKNVSSVKRDLTLENRDFCCSRTDRKSFCFPIWTGKFSNDESHTHKKNLLFFHFVINTEKSPILGEFYSKFTIKNKILAKISKNNPIMMGIRVAEQSKASKCSLSNTALRGLKSWQSLK